MLQDTTHHFFLITLPWLHTVEVTESIMLQFIPPHLFTQLNLKKLLLLLRNNQF